MAAWFENTLIGRYVVQKEQAFFRRHIGHNADKCVAQIGQDWLEPSENIIYVPQDVKMATTQMAWASHSLDKLLMPHSHEFSESPVLALAEAARVLKPNGKLVVTGFNPYSLWRNCDWFDGKRLPLKNHCLPLTVFKKQIRQLGFEIEYGQFMVYVPPVRTQAALDFWRFLEKAGDRWWPQCAAVYGLVLTKQVVAITPLPELETEFTEQPVALGVARTLGK